MVSGASTITSARATNPVKLLTPRPRGESVWAYSSSFGGGLVAGDEVRLELDIEAGARCFLGTQASTKIYRNPALRPCSQQTHAKLGPGSLLVFAPDPIQPFAGSSYQQRQEFHLATDASLVLLDWFSAGRTARGERWAFNRFESRNVVYRKRGASSLANGCPDQPSEEPVFLDSLCLNAADGSISAPHRTGRFNCFATLLLVGPAVASLAANILAEVGQQPVPRHASILGSASPVRDGAVVRLAGEGVEAVGRELHRHLAPLSKLLGDDPWARKW
jgi:urease accessory protein